MIKVGREEESTKIFESSPASQRERRSRRAERRQWNRRVEISLKIRFQRKLDDETSIGNIKIIENERKIVKSQTQKNFELIESQKNKIKIKLRNEKLRELEIYFSHSRSSISLSFLFFLFALLCFAFIFIRLISLIKFFSLQFSQFSLEFIKKIVKQLF